MSSSGPQARENARLRAAAWYARNKARASATMRTYRELNAEVIKERKRLAYIRERDTPEFREKLRIRTEKAKATKPAYDREYRERNADKLRVLKDQWRAENAGLIRAVKHSYKARRRVKENSGDSSKDVHSWLSRVAKVCLWCKQPCGDNFHIDHFYPLARGGEHRVTNLVIACPTCNLKKNALAPEDFCERNGLEFSEIERHRCDVAMLG